MKKASVCPSKHALMSPPPPSHILPHHDEDYCLQYLLSPRTLSHLATVSDDVDHELQTQMENAKHLQSMANTTNTKSNTMTNSDHCDLEQLLHDEHTSLKAIQHTINMLDGYSPIALDGGGGGNGDDRKLVGLEQFMWQRRRSLMSTFEDAETINAPNPIQRQMEQLLTVCNSYNGKGWQPPKFDVDLNAHNDGHSFLSPKLFHSKKMLDSNLTHQKKQRKHERIKKKGPKEIGRMTGFKSPKFSESVLKENEDGTLFLDTYRSWYATTSSSSSNTSKHKHGGSKHTQQRHHSHSHNHNHPNQKHSRWSSNISCGAVTAKPSSVARSKSGKLSLRLSHSDRARATEAHHEHVLDHVDIGMEMAMAMEIQDDDENEEDDGVVFLHDYNRENDSHNGNKKKTLSMRMCTRTPSTSSIASKPRKCKNRKSSSSSLSSSSSSHKRRMVKSARGNSNKTYWNSNTVDFLQEKCNTLTTRRRKQPSTARSDRRDRSRSRSKHLSDLSGCASVRSVGGGGVSEHYGGADLYMPRFDGRKLNQKRARTLDINNTDTDLRDLRFSDYLQHLQFDVSALKPGANHVEEEEDDSDVEVARACKRRKSIELDSPCTPMSQSALNKASEGPLPSLQETQLPHVARRNTRTTGPRSKSNTVRDFKSSKKRNSKKLLSQVAQVQSPVSTKSTKREENNHHKHSEASFAMDRGKFAQTNNKPRKLQTQTNLSPSPSPCTQSQMQPCNSQRRKSTSLSASKTTSKSVDVDPISIDICINNDRELMNSDLESGNNSCNSIMSYSTNSSHIESKIPFDSVSPISPAITPPYLDVPSSCGNICTRNNSNCVSVGYKDQPFLSPTPISHSICTHPVNETDYGCHSPSHNGSDAAGFVFNNTAAAPQSSSQKKTPTTTTLSPHEKQRKSSGFYIIVSPRHSNNHSTRCTPVQSPNDHIYSSKTNGDSAEINHRKTRKIHRGALQIKVTKTKTKPKTTKTGTEQVEDLWD